MKEFEFKPKDWVLVRDTDVDAWSLNIFSHKVAENEDYPYYCIGGDYLWKMCIPYEGNEHLLGTTDPYEPPYEPKDGDFVILYSSRFQNEEWIGIFSEYSEEPDYEGFPILYCFLTSSNILDTHQCIKWNIRRPATEEEKQKLLDALHEAGKDWNAENKQIVAYKWKPKQGEIVLIIEYNEAHGRFIPVEYPCDWNNLKSNAYNYGMMFKISDGVKADAFCDKLNEAIKNVK